MLQDSIVDCRNCNSPSCYQVFHNNLVTWKCFTCGYTSNSSMFSNSDFVKAFEETLPSLYKDILVTDSDGFNWYPMFYDIPKIGLVFADGTTKDNWLWRAAKYVPVTREERDKFKRKDGTYATHKPDMNNSQTFDRFEFLMAVAFLGI